MTHLRLRRHGLEIALNLGLMTTIYLANLREFFAFSADFPSKDKLQDKSVGNAA